VARLGQEPLSEKEAVGDGEFERRSTEHLLEASTQVTRAHAEVLCQVLNRTAVERAIRDSSYRRVREV
jgi:hypothetical protein